MADGDRTPGPPPKEAVDYLRRKGVRTGYDYQEVWREEHTRAFTVANMMKVDLLTDVQASIAKAQEEGWPADKWKKEMADELAKRGWWGRLPPPDPNDPEAVRKANLYISRRLDTIWRVNTRQAAQAGVWERGMRSTSHPWVLYRVGPSKVHREQHLAWDGVLLKKDDPFWGVANPMNGWGCKCYTRFVSQAQYERYRRSGIPQPPAAGKKGRKAVQTSSPELRVETYKNKMSGERHTGFKGIDPGFERNPGIGRMEQLGQQFRRTNRALALAWDVAPGKPTKQRPDIKPVADALDVQLTDQATKGAAEAAIDAIGEFQSDGDLPRIEVQDMPPGETSLGYFWPRHRDSASGQWVDTHIAINASGAWPEMTTAHEVGHFLDHSGLPPAGSYSVVAAENAPAPPPRPPRQVRLMQLLLREIRKTKTHQKIVEAQDEAKKNAAASTGAKKKYWEDWEQHFDYLTGPLELFARAYAQYVAWRSGDQALLDQVDGILTHPEKSTRIRQWPYAEFLPFIHRFDTLFEERGWLTRTKL